MAGFKCPYCNQFMSENESTKFRKEVFMSDAIRHNAFGPIDPHLLVTFYKCPNDDCKKITVFVDGMKDVELEKIHLRICPAFKGEILPSYIPEQIRRDYEEACSIIEPSPKASATLSRRCLQGMIRDFWKIKKNNLHQEIEALRDLVSNDLIDALLSLKSIGNIGAHPETDINLIINVEPDEAEALIKLIEYLVDEWYTVRENKTKLLKSINTISAQKESARENQQ